jgi:hypothetical protein
MGWGPTMCLARKMRLTGGALFTGGLGGGWSLGVNNFIPCCKHKNAVAHKFTPCCTHFLHHHQNESHPQTAETKNKIYSARFKKDVYCTCTCTLYMYLKLPKPHSNVLIYSKVSKDCA